MLRITLILFALILQSDLHAKGGHFNKPHHQGKVGDFDNYYTEWRNKRIDCIIDFYGADFFKNKKLLEVGCAHGDIGYRFKQLGAEVTVSDGNPNHGPIINAKYPDLHFICADVEAPWQFEDHYDIIIHMGLLYHVRDPESVLKDACKHCDHLVLETDVIDNYDPKNVTFRSEAGFDQGIHGIGSVFSEYFVERCLKESGFNFWMLRGNRCDSYCWIYDFVTRGSNKTYRRLWFCKRPDIH